MDIQSKILAVYASLLMRYETPITVPSHIYDTSVK